MITEFKDENAFLSNFYPAVVYIPLTVGMIVRAPTVEHGYQALKTLDPDQRLKIISCDTPGQAKRMGSKVDLRPDWENVKVSIMGILLRQKFMLSSELQEKLCATGEELLLEGNSWHDNFWGVCSCTLCLGFPKNNTLGQLLMEIRKEIRVVWVGNYDRKP